MFNQLVFKTEGGRQHMMMMKDKHHSMFTSGGKLKVLRHCRSAEAQTSPSLAISADPSKRRLEIAFNL